MNALQVAWACVHDRSSIARLITLDWLADAGGSDHSAAMRVAWGTVRDAVVTGLRPSWPQRHDRLAVRERVVSGLFLSATVGPSVRIAQVLEARGLPGALGPALLSSLVADLIREAPVSFEGDALGLALRAGDVPEERFDSYLAALAAGGPIVPATSANSEWGGRNTRIRSTRLTRSGTARSFSSAPPIRSRLIARGMQGADVAWLRERLDALEGKRAKGAGSDVYDASLEQRVVAFQKSRALTADGLVGDETLLQLTLATREPGVPSVSSRVP